MVTTTYPTDGDDLKLGSNRRFTALPADWLRRLWVLAMKATAILTGALEGREAIDSDVFIGFQDECKRYPFADVGN